MTNGICKRIFLKENNMSATDRTGGYSSDLYTEDDELVQVHSPTDSSEDSVEVKVNPIPLRSKRKGTDPKKFDFCTVTPPPKKRMCLKISEEERKNAREPFRPWNVSNNTKCPSIIDTTTTNTNTTLNPALRDSLVRCPTPIGVENDSESPLPLLKKSTSDEPHQRLVKNSKSSYRHIPGPDNSDFSDGSTLRVPFHPSFAPVGAVVDVERAIQQSSNAFPSLRMTESPEEFSSEDSRKPTISVKNLDSLRDSNSGCSSSNSNNNNNSNRAIGIQRREQRNYKNMTRERRIEANARERTRVHTISAAFDTLRRAIPSYSHNQKLSKLSVLRIACSYIATLSNIVTDSEDQCENSLAECVDNVTRTIQREGKLRKKKDESD
ncbi:uncharacterized protein LOC108732652 [Agrilus planipennis]|uniref:Uncharacterized protein LOC108732652 n=1 Tax=Agrilus planipennis TaxID=224129 RepID=A0A1W4WF34_AGRPL|nr:uncharacterized protein LOC108732652 [Agrilus planipennis]